MPRVYSARTVLAQRIRERRLTLEEFCEQLELFARENNEVGTVSIRHVQRLAAEQCTSDQLRPATARLNDLQLAVWQGDRFSVADEHEALELARRVAASDVSAKTLNRLEGMVDELAVKYSVTPPRELIDPVRRHVSYVMWLLDARKTLDEHRRLLIVGGWLSLMAATLYTDLERRTAANSWLATPRAWRSRQASTRFMPGATKPRHGKR
jgi:hypothetical protein